MSSNKPIGSYDGAGKATIAVVGILNLQVILAQEGELWIAQALEFDYAAGGESLDDVKSRFEQGLCATIQENFNAFGNIDKLLSTKPSPEYSLDLLKNQSLTKLYYSQTTQHKFMTKLTAAAPGFFPYGTIEYFGPKSAAQKLVAQA